VVALRAGEGERHVLAGQLAAEQRRADRLSGAWWKPTNGR